MEINIEIPQGYNGENQALRKTSQLRIFQDVMRKLINDLIYSDKFDELDLGILETEILPEYYQIEKSDIDGMLNYSDIAETYTVDKSDLKIKSINELLGV